jgi:hypothetical protein
MDKLQAELDALVAQGRHGKVKHYCRLGRLTGEAAAKSLPRERGKARRIWRLAADDTVVCRCENVAVSALRDAFAAGHLTPNTIKRVTRAGMGWCGGRTCLHAVAALADLHGAPGAALMTPRPLARPVTLAALANQGASSP